MKRNDKSLHYRGLN
ncbi:TPA: hypothetical protein OCP93_003228 [Escherichia coli]|nr:hypothetical protein [Escherichia coli]